MSDSEIEDIRSEFERASRKFKPFASQHEGLAVIEEEFLELRQEVFWGTLERAREECVQLGAMALRFIHDSKDWGRK